jgi:hypothetical protein
MDEVVTAGHGRAEELLRSLGLPPAVDPATVDVTDITVTRNADIGQRRQYAVTITALSDPPNGTVGKVAAP